MLFLMDMMFTNTITFRSSAGQSGISPAI